jgi:16S rRNA (cytidine1402-2'-O)-methyltransferase
MSVLYVVSTPIGNLSDQSDRAKHLFNSIEYVIAEDTRVSKKLFMENKKKVTIISVHEHSPQSKLEQAVNFLEKGDTVLVSDAGTPGISDPGNEIVRLAVKSGHRTTPVPGPSAVSAALSICSWPVNRFIFLGFLPRKQNDRISLLKSVKENFGSVVCFESPHRLQKSLKDIETVTEDCEIMVCRELTKIHEEVFRGSSSEAQKHFIDPIKGEFTIVIRETLSENPGISDETILAEIYQARKMGLTGRSIVDHVVEKFPGTKNKTYQLEISSR